MLTQRSWHPESLLWLGCILMVTLGIGGGLAGFAEAGSVEQMAVNVAVMPLSIFISIIAWMFISAKFYDQPIRFKETFGLNRGKLTTCLVAGLAGGIVTFCGTDLSILTSDHSGVRRNSAGTKTGDSDLGAIPN